jgi:1-acyl-sn-glycerol-3-phosphate acyltransferase
LFRATIVGRKNVPRSGPVILASNHLSFIDSVVITLFARRPVSFLAKDSYFTGTGVKGLISRTFFRGIGAIPVSRGAGQAAQQALDAGLGLLKDGEAFAIYPEGTRSRSWEMLPFKDGAFRLAIESGAPILPIAVAGTRNAMAKGSFRFLPARAIAQLLEPIPTTGLTLADVGTLRQQTRERIEAGRRALAAELGLRVGDATTAAASA